MQNKGDCMLINFKEYYNLLHPKPDFIQICKLCELEIKNIEKNIFDPKILRKLTNKVARNFISSKPNFFLEMYTGEGHDYNHRYKLLLKIIERYIMMRLHSLPKLKNSTI